MDKLRKYNENSYYGVEDCVDRLIQLSNLRESDGLKGDLENALYCVEAMAQNKYNPDFWRTFYNVLLATAGQECGL